LNRTSMTYTSQVGGAPPSAQSVGVSSNPPVAFSATSGAPWLIVTPDVGITPASLFVSVNPSGLVPGTYNSVITITSTGVSGNNSITLPVTYTISSSGVPLITTVVNAASYVSGPVSPGEIVAIGGASIGPANPTSLTLDQNGKVATSLNGV